MNILCLSVLSFISVKDTLERHVVSIEIICANVFQLYVLWYKVGKTCCKKMVIDTLHNVQFDSHRVYYVYF
jgi:hypothetical protein